MCMIEPIRRSAHRDRHKMTVSNIATRIDTRFRLQVVFVHISNFQIFKIIYKKIKVLINTLNALVIKLRYVLHDAHDFIPIHKDIYN